MIHISAVSPDLDVGQHSADIVISHPSEYLAAYKRILQSVYSESGLQVQVHNKKVAGWLKLMAQHYGPGNIIFNSLTVRSYFEERTGIPVPLQYSELEISSSGLLELDIPASGQASFEDYILEVFFGSFFNKPDVVLRVNEIVAAFEPEQWQDALRRPLVNKILQERFRKLQSELKGQIAHIQLLEWLEKSPEIYIRNLSALKLLRFYDTSLGKKVFGPSYGELVKLNLDLHRIPVVMRENENTLTEIRLFIKQLVDRTDITEAFEDLLEHASGFLEDELHATVKLLRNKKKEITSQDIKRVARKFVYLQNRPHIAQVTVCPQPVCESSDILR